MSPLKRRWSINMGRNRQEGRAYSVLKGILKFIIICFILLIPTSAFFLTCKLEEVVIEGNTRYTDDEIKKKIITQSTDGNTLLFYLRLKHQGIESIPFVEGIDVELINKNQVKIQVYEKVVIGCIEYMGGYMYFDKDGIIVESSNNKLEEVPFVTGLKFNKIVLHDQLKIQKEELFHIILNITQLIYKYELSVHTIGINSDNEVTLRMGDIKVLLGKRDIYDEQIAQLKDLIPKAGNKKLTIDMKNFKEGQNRIIAKPDE